MKKAEKEIMVAGLEAKGFEKTGVFEQKDGSFQIYAEVWQDSKHVNVFTYDGDSISHYFFQVGDKKAIKKLLKYEDLDNKEAESQASVIAFKEALGYMDSVLTSEEQELWKAYAMDKLTSKVIKLDLQIKTYEKKRRKVNEKLEFLRKKEVKLLSVLSGKTGISTLSDAEDFLKMPKKDIVEMIKANQPKLEVE